MSLEEIEAAIERLPEDELAALTSWLTEYNARRWDVQIERDLESGRLDAVLSEARAVYNAGRARPL